ncbi:MAG: hypothetical protein ACXAAH_15120 [Promethearchaeota archaeon]|jgi:hypothetical protein
MGNNGNIVIKRIKSLIEKYLDADSSDPEMARERLYKIEEQVNDYLSRNITKTKPLFELIYTEYPCLEYNNATGEDLGGDYCSDCDIRFPCWSSQLDTRIQRLADKLNHTRNTFLRELDDLREQEEQFFDSL